MATTYEIKSGDTLSDIAKKNNTTVAEITRANPSITDPNKIYSGQTITIPGSSSGTSSSGEISGGGALPVTGAYRTPSASGVSTPSAGSSGGDFDYDAYMADVQKSIGEAPTLDTSYDAEIDAIFEKIKNREKFSYDFNEDALYDQYRDSYTRAGRLAMQDTVGQAAALTGGYANSWGESAGQQAFNQYMQELNSIIPTLDERAYARYVAEGDELYKQYSLAADRRDTAYGRHQDDLANWWQEVSLYNDREDAAYSKEIEERNWNYQLERDAIEDSRYAAESNADARAREIELLLAMGDYDGLDKMGYNTSSLRAQQAAELASAYSKASGSSGGDEESFNLWSYGGIDKESGKAVFYDSNNKKKIVEVGVNPYTGTKNPDISNGTFNNGYQPNNIGGQKLSKTGDTYNMNGREQNIWQTPDGRLWIWDGSKNRYYEVEIED